MSAYQQIHKNITGVPKGPLERYRFGSIDSTGKLIQSTASTASIGVIYEPNKADEPTQVVIAGVAFIELGAALTAGTAVKSDANGKAVAVAEGDIPTGILMVGGTSGAIGSVLLK